MDKTQLYSTWGDKLLQHTDVLYSIQNNKIFKPVTVQLSLCETCDSDCPFCSVAGRPLKSYLPFQQVKSILEDFKHLGAKSLEITGGGNPLLYRDKTEKKTINDVVTYAKSLGYDIGIITNSEKLERHLDPQVYNSINWIRVSLIKLDEGVKPEEYDFGSFPITKLGLSYIIYDGTGDLPDPMSRTKKPYQGTTVKTIENIAKLLQINPDIKFVRIAGNCLIKGNNAIVRDRYADVIKSIDIHDKFFIKDIGYDDGPYSQGCYIGAIRPYIAPHPEGGDYQVYICTSHVLNHRNYDLKYSLGSVKDIIQIWNTMNINYSTTGKPYSIGTKSWEKECKFCYYKFNNKLLHTVANEMPDRNFP